MSIKLIDPTGAVYFDKILAPVETTARLSFDLQEGDYQLKISNGLEMEVRDIKISTQVPVVQMRKLTVL